MKLSKIRLAHVTPVTLYTRYRWISQIFFTLLLVVVPSLHLLKLDLANDQYWLLGYEVAPNRFASGRGAVAGYLLCQLPRELFDWALAVRLGVLMGHVQPICRFSIIVAPAQTSHESIHGV